jgi:predicted nucleic acid-binding protein
MNAADTLQFVDTNILIYAHDRSAGVKHERARQLLAALWENRTGALSIQVLQEFYVNVTQKVAKPLTPEVAAQIISDLAAWQVHQPVVDDVLDAIHFQTRHQLSFWDAMILASAVALGCEIVWSEDLNPGQRYDTVMVTNPFL